MNVIDPQTWRDAEDGRALRELDAALPKGAAHFVLQRALATAWEVRIYSREDPRGEAGGHYGDTIAEAADACRKALVSK